MRRWTQALAPLVLSGIAAWILAPAVHAATRYDPALRFHQLRTPHFILYFHAGEEELARRLAGIVERVRTELAARMQVEPRAVTHVILVDQSDIANGWATPLPYNTIELTAAPPPGVTSIGNTDDWLTLVFAHEYAHILHLDRSGGWAAPLRRLFGRTFPLFPNMFLPQWQIEGLATFEESAVTGQGRVVDTEFAMIVDDAARTRRLLGVDRVSGGLVDWPGTNGAYAYGAYFHEYLATRFGEEQLNRLAQRSAAALPYTGSRAFRAIFGESLGSLWRHFERAREAASSRPLTPPGRRLTHHGFVVTGPRFLQSGPQRLLYSAHTPHEFPGIFAVGEDNLPPVKLASRYLGAHLTVSRDTVYFDQIELVRSVAAHRDLFALDLPTGRVRRLTHRARLTDPDVSPRGDALACILLVPGGGTLAVVPLSRAGIALDQARILIAEPDTQLAAPRWSPDGRWMVVERRRLRGPSELVLVEATTGAVQSLVSSRDARNVTPAWAPDGREVIFASNRNGQPFNLYAIDLADRRLFKITDLAGGARYPDVSPDGREIAYVGYGPDGYDLSVLAVDRSQWQPVIDAEQVIDAEPEPLGSPRPGEAQHKASLPETGWNSSRFGSYSPWPTLAPRFWVPIVDIHNGLAKLGAASGGIDALGRHAYGVSASGYVRRPPGARNQPVEWGAYYAYDRWRPTIFLSAAGSTTFEQSIDLSGRAVEGDTRDRQIEVGLSLPIRHIRRAQIWRASVAYRQRRTEIDAFSSPQHRPAVRVGWAFSSAQMYGYSISPEVGVSLALTAEQVRPLFGASAAADAVTLDVRTFVRVGRPHAVLALRGAAGLSRGDESVRRAFRLGGAASNTNLLDFGAHSVSLLRAFPRDAFAGRAVALGNVDYRIPLWSLQRGHGTLPFFARTLYAAAFVDAGHAWDQQFRVADVKLATGLELALDAVLGYYAPVTSTLGIAWGRDPAGQPRHTRAIYLRIGRAF